MFFIWRSCDHHMIKQRLILSGVCLENEITNDVSLPYPYQDRMGLFV